MLVVIVVTMIERPKAEAVVQVNSLLWLHSYKKDLRHLTQLWRML